MGPQSFTGYLRVALDFLWGSALRGKFKEIFKSF